MFMEIRLNRFSLKFLRVLGVSVVQFLFLCFAVQACIFKQVLIFYSVLSTLYSGLSFRTVNSVSFLRGSSSRHIVITSIIPPGGNDAVLDRNVRL